MKHVLALALALLTTSACSITAGQTARTNGEGNLQVGVEPGVIGVSGAGASALGPGMDLAVRYGVSDTMDVGGRIGSSGLELQTKFQVTGDDGVILSPAPSLQAVFFGAGGVGGGFIAVPVPLLIDIPIGESALVLGPRLKPSFFLGGGGGTTAGGLVLSGGASVGYAAKLSDGFRLFPEVGAEIPFLAAGAGGGVSGAGVGVSGLVWTARINLLIGKTK